MEVRKIVVVVEDVEVARAALKWALHNLCRCGDTITLLHVYSNSTRSKSKKKLRLLRLKGFQLALSFKDICNPFPNAKVDIVVTEGDPDGKKIASMVREIGASTLVVGLHDRSFLYKLAMAHNNIANNFNCKVIAMKQPPPSPPPSTAERTTAAAASISSTNMDFSQVEISKLLAVPETPGPRIPYRICPNPSAIIWRSRKTRRRGSP
ncbi:UspA [Dillenia turbinata]|uniref:UspA n=1 Tax=Dillenia turbinata TaxID=194707 RepID=A0AAN8V516_9MAGN